METQISIRDFVRNAYKVYGAEVNINRHLPHILDGLKPSSQRLIFSSLGYKDYVKTATLIGQTVGLYHPHGLDSLKKTTSNLVNKLGIFDGQGNFGYQFLDGNSCEEANPRYTEVRLKPAIKNQIQMFSHLVPTTVSEMGYSMPTYVPTPIPFALISGDIGISVGINQKIPAFTAKSLINAYRADDPNLLESQYGLELLKEKSGLSRLWTEGAGRLFLRMKTVREPNGITIEGDTSVFVPDLSRMMKEFKFGNVDFEDLSSGTPKVRFTRAPKIRRITTAEIQQYVENAANFDDSYYIRIHDGEVAQPISIRTWIDKCYKNYSDLALSGVNSEIKKLERKVIFYNNLKSVYNELVTTNKSKTDIASSKNIELGIVNEIASKSADYVRDCNVGQKVAQCESKIKDLKATNADKLIDSYIEVLK